ncbi:hypothetical protein BH11MYX3_BH11MYX3_16480 [soil metagenome]
MKLLTRLGVLGFATASIATTTTAAPPPPPPPQPICYELSSDGKAWSKTPEVMCVALTDKTATITLESGMPPNPTRVAVFQLDLKRRVRCLDCNKDVFALSNPSNSVFNALQISFDGTRDVTRGSEQGSVSIGKTRFRYRSR